MAEDWTQWSDGNDLAGISRSTNPLTRAGYDPETLRADPVKRMEAMAAMQAPYPAAGGGAPAQPAAPQAPAAAPQRIDAPTSAQVSRTPNMAQMAGITAEAMQEQLKLGKAAGEKAMEMAGDTGPDISGLQARRAALAMPTPYRDPNSGQVLPEAEKYAPTTAQRIGRGIESAVIGLATGGLPGAIVGAVEPGLIRGGTAYGAPNRAYNVAEQQRQAELGATDSAIQQSLDMFKERTEARKNAGAELRGAGTALGEVGKSAKDILSAQTAQQKNAAQVQEHGLKYDEQGNLVPLSYEEMTPTQQADYDLKQSRQELADATAALRRAQNDPNSAEFQLAQARVATAQMNARTALGRLGLSEEDFAMRSRGTDLQGNPLPGALELPGGQTVGTAFQGNVRPTGTQRDAAGRANVMDTLGRKIEAGLNDPEIRAYMGPAAGRIWGEGGAKLGTLPKKVSEFRNDLISYGAFQAGMHPVRGIGALHYFDQVMGGMGQTPENLLGKIRSNRATGAAVEGVGTPKVSSGGTRPAATPAPAATGNWFAQHQEAK